MAGGSWLEEGGGEKEDMEHDDTTFSFMVRNHHPSFSFGLQSFSPSLERPWRHEGGGDVMLLPLPPPSAVAPIYPPLLIMIMLTTAIRHPTVRLPPPSPQPDPWTDAFGAGSIIFFTSLGLFIPGEIWLHDWFLKMPSSSFHQMRYHFIWITI